MSIKPVRAACITDTMGALLGESRIRRRPRNIVKHDVFEHPTPKKLVDTYTSVDRIRPGVDRGSTRGRAEVDQKGRRQGRRAYITFGYQPKASGKDTGPWPAPAADPGTGQHSPGPGVFHWSGPLHCEQAPEGLARCCRLRLQ